MGMFDYVTVTCPHCKKIVEDQTKSFNCMMETINLDKELATYVVSLFLGEWTCDHCNGKFMVEAPIPLTMKATTRKL